MEKNNLMLVDVHAHLDYPEVYKDIDNVIKRAKKAGVKKIIANGIEPDSNRKVVELANKYDIVFPALGLYPVDALSVEEKDRFKNFDPDLEIDFIKSQDFVAIGEVGLDLKHGKDLESQILLFKKFIGLAKEKDVPIIIHSRKAEKQVLEVLEKELKPINEKDKPYDKVILHCFSGKKSLIKKASDLGYHFSIPTNIVKSHHFQNLVDMVNISQLLTETDCPFLSPFPDQSNEPSFVIEAVKKIAEIKNMTVEDTANNIFMNYQRLF